MIIFSGNENCALDTLFFVTMVYGLSVRHFCVGHFLDVPSVRRTTILVSDIFVQTSN